MVGSVFFPELFKKLSEGEVNTLCSFCEVGKPIVGLSLSIYYFVAGLLNHVCFILPHMVGPLQSTISAEDTGSISLYIIIEEAFWSHRFVVALRNFVVVRQV
jgi:hypothetical protein